MVEDKIVRRKRFSLKYIVLHGIKKKTIYKKVAIWLIILLYVAIIFSFSNQTGLQSDRISKGIVNEIKQTVSLPHIIQEKKFIQSLDYNYLLRKCAHVTEYFLLFILMYFAFRISGVKSKMAALITFTFCIVYSCLDEYHQSFVGSRTPSIKDVIIDVSGSILALIAIYFIKFIKFKIEKYSNP